MNARERYIETLTFGTPDRVPFEPGAGRESTLRRWRAEGLPEDRRPTEFALELLGIEMPPAQSPRIDPGIDFRLRPTFEEKILEHRDGHYVVQDWKGNICEISDEYDTRHLRHAIDFVTRRWIKCPVETRDDWAAIRTRYDAADPGRFPADFDARCAALKDRDGPLTIAVSGPFWQLREWCGFEGLCTLMADDPDFVAEMAAFWTDFVSQMLDRILPRLVPDGFFISEDMAYKGASMISMPMVRAFCVPGWTAWSRKVRAAGCPIVDMDSDGFVGELIPLWIESGINVCDPIEVAAHCDIVDFRRRFGRRMAYRQGIDKRCIAKGGEALRAEIRRIEPVVRDGGYIPGCDHGIPADVSWENFVEYCRRLAEITGWRQAARRQTAKRTSRS
jgi:uroporphyrinogen decarboxylase